MKPLVALILPWMAWPAMAADAPAPFDGRWGITLVCEDVHGEDSFAKGYTFVFEGQVAQGRLLAQYGEVGHPSSVTLKGHVGNDGTVEIDARGRTGRVDHTVGHVPPSTPYRYTMSGRFEGNAGHAERRELRPCKADFTRLP